MIDSLRRAFALRPLRLLPALIVSTVGLPSLTDAQAPSADYQALGFLRSPCPTGSPLAIRLDAPEKTPLATTRLIQNALRRIGDHGHGSLTLGPGVWALVPTPYSPYAILSLPSCLTLQGAGDSVTTLALAQTQSSVRSLLGTDQQGNVTLTRDLRIQHLGLTHQSGQAPPWLIQLGGTSRVRIEHVRFETEGRGAMEITSPLATAVVSRHLDIRLRPQPAPRVGTPAARALAVAGPQVGLRLGGQQYVMDSLRIEGTEGSSSQIGIELLGQQTDLSAITLQHLAIGVRLTGRTDGREVGRITMRQINGLSLGTGVEMLSLPLTNIGGVRIEAAAFDVSDQVLWAHSDTPSGAGRVANITLRDVVGRGVRGARSVGVRLEAAAHEAMTLSHLTLAQFPLAALVLGGPTTTITRTLTMLDGSSAYDVGCASPGGAVVLVNKQVADVDLRLLRLTQRAPCAPPLVAGQLSALGGTVPGLLLPGATTPPPGR